MKCSIVVLLICQIFWVESNVILLQGVEAFDALTDHYWRDYNGLVPADAIPGGLTEDGDTTYIGQFTLKAKYHHDVAELDTMPAVITKGFLTAVGSYGGLSENSTSDSNTKVLCSAYFNSRYKWYSRTVQIPPRCNFVVVGTEDDIPLYAGKTEVEGKTLTGKIFSNGRYEFMVSLPFQGRELHMEKYEVLTYCY